MSIGARWTEAQYQDYQKAKDKKAIEVQPVLHKKSPMNKTETEYSNRLEALKKAGEILDWKFEALRFRLADRTMYNPDFFVVTRECFEIHEVKGGHIWDDSMVKWKVAAEMYPWFNWVLAQKKKGEWGFTFK